MTAEFTPGVWATLPRLSRIHFVPYVPGTRTPAIASMCGCARTGAKHEKWDTNVMTGKSGTEEYIKPVCKRCLEAKEQERERVSDAETSYSPDAKPFSMSMYLSVAEDQIPIAWVPIPDLEALITLLEAQRSKDDDVCPVANNVREGAILGLKKHVADAKERSEKKRKSSTWVYTGREDEKG